MAVSDPRNIFNYRGIAYGADGTAPNGSELRYLCELPRGQMRAFKLWPGAVSKAVAHRTVEEIWYCTAGLGEIWGRFGEREETYTLREGTSVKIPTGTHFQFRCHGDTPLEVVAVTMPGFPGGAEAYSVTGKWKPTL